MPLRRSAPFVATKGPLSSAWPGRTPAASMSSSVRPPGRRRPTALVPGEWRCLTWQTRRCPAKALIKSNRHSVGMEFPVMVVFRPPLAVTGLPEHLLLPNTAHYLTTTSPVPRKVSATRARCRPARASHSASQVRPPARSKSYSARLPRRTITVARSPCGWSATQIRRFPTKPGAQS